MIRRLLLLNGLAVVAAVIQHATGWGFTALFWWTDRYSALVPPDFSQLGGVEYYGLRVAEQFTMFAPPAFLFVSGVFVAFGAGRDGLGYGWDKAKGRIQMLVIPYVAWSVAIFVMRAAEGTLFTPRQYLTKLLIGGAAEPYYYVPLVIQVYLLAPVIAPLVKRHWKPVLATAAAVQVLSQAARYPLLLGWEAPAAARLVELTPGWAIPTTALWFVGGVAAGFHWTALTQLLIRWRAALLPLMVGFGVLGVLEWEWLLRRSDQAWLSPMPTVIDTFFSGALVLTFLAFAKFEFPAHEQLNRLGERSFGIYLMHAPVLEIVARTTYHAAPGVLDHQLLFQLLLVAGGLAAPLLLMAAVNRSPARPAYNYVFG